MSSPTNDPPVPTADVSEVAVTSPDGAPVDTTPAPKVIDEALLEEQAPALAAAKESHEAAVVAAEEQFLLQPADVLGAEGQRLLRTDADRTGFVAAIRAADEAYRSATAGFEARK